jgi:hypothetical protein
MPEVTLIGIDEQTGLIDNGFGERLTSWSVYGQGDVVLYRHGKVTIHGNGQQFDDNFGG